jgi:small subunit ribosomal protein S5
MKAITRTIVRRAKIDTSDMDLSERLVNLARVTKVVKGGKQMHFRALVVVGDAKGHVGAGLGKAREVPEAIHKAGVVARKNLIEITMAKNTIPHETLAKFGAAKVLLKPATAGTGVIAGGGVRAVIEAAGVKDVLTKSLGASSPINVVKATILALANLRDPKSVVARRKADVVVSAKMEVEKGG